MEKPNTFGTYLNLKRQERKISLRKFAEMLKISPVYMCNMEKDRNPAPSEDILERMVSLLVLSDEERTHFYDLAAKSKNSPTVSQDLPEYIMDRDIVRVALRTAKDVDATDEEWQEFISMLEARRRKIQEEKK
ncbi:MAG: transcriptional regulator [Clostridiales bacterium 41_12_two_minus]|jgi:hypothetical protein|nr:MAG: transcriptional regulator [Clostridiales bacterium 41_12_two_minus]